MKKFLCAIALVSSMSPSAIAAQEADVIVRNARIWTGDTLRPSAQAVAIRGDRLITVGTNADVDAHRTSRTRVIDAGGRFVTPGFIDDHTHFNQAGALLIGANLLDVSTAAPFAQRVKAAVARMSPGAWLTGGDWGAYEDSPANSTGAAAGQPRPARFTPDRSIIDSIVLTVASGCCGSAARIACCSAVAAPPLSSRPRITHVGVNQPCARRRLASSTCSSGE